MKAKLVPPNNDKNWSLQFIEVPFKKDCPDFDLTNNPEKSNIWYWCQHYGNHYNVSPFLQGNSGDWMMIEFWSSSQGLILEASLAICEILKVELEI